MRIVTGLVPAVKLTRYPRRLDFATSFVEFTEAAYAHLVAPDLTTTDSWTLSFSTPSASAAAPAGDIVSVMLLRSEPKITRHGSQFAYPLGQPLLTADLDREARKREGIPDDALVNDLLDVYTCRRRFSWWEVEA